MAGKVEQDIEGDKVKVNGESPARPIALVTIDMQVDYFPGGRFPLWKQARALRRARIVLDAARAAGLPVIHVKHEGLDPAGNFLVAGTAGVALHAGLGVRAGETVVVKHRPDSFLGTGLNEILLGLALDPSAAGPVVWMGSMTWMCVDTTVRAAKALGWNNILVEDACAAGWMLKDGLPVFPWVSHRAFIAALGYHHAKVLNAKDAAKLFNDGKKVRGG